MGVLEFAAVGLLLSAAAVYAVLRLVVWPPLWLRERRMKAMLRPPKDKRVKGPGERGSLVRTKADDHRHRRQTDKEDARTRESTSLG